MCYFPTIYCFYCVVLWFKTIKKVSKLVSSEIFTSTSSSSSSSESATDDQNESESESDDSENEEKGIFLFPVPF